MKEEDILMHLKGSLPQPNFLTPMAVIALEKGEGIFSPTPMEVIAALGCTQEYIVG
jgi:hypothetical protein